MVGRRVTPADLEKNFVEIGAVVVGHQSPRRAGLDDAPFVHDDDLIAEPLDLFHIVRSEQYRRAMQLAILFEQTSDPIRTFRIEQRRRLIEQQQARRIEQGFSQRRAVFCPAEIPPVTRSSKSTIANCSANSSIRRLRSVTP